MNFTVSGANFNQEESKKAASIQVKSNKETNQTGNVKSFRGVIVSAAQKDASKMDQNTYKSLLDQAQQVKEQIQASATSAKDNLKALFDKLNGSEAVKIDEEGFSLNDATPDEMVTIVDKIQIELVAYCKDYQVTDGSVSKEQIRQVVGSEGMADAVANKMQSASLSATDENVKQVTDALDQVSSMKNLSENAKNYLVKNQLEPTIDNVYKAEHLSDGSGNTGATGMAQSPLSDQEWKQLQPQVEKLLGQAGVEVNEQTLSGARNMIESQIPVTAENLGYKAALDEIDLNDLTSQEGQDKLVDQIIQNMATGESAGSTWLTGKQDTFSQVAEALNTLKNADYQSIQYLAMSGKTFTLGNLRDAMIAANRESGMGVLATGSMAAGTAQSVAWQQNTIAEAVLELNQGVTDYPVTGLDQVSQGANASVDQNQNASQGQSTGQGQSGQQSSQANVITSYKQLQEVRIMLTAQSGLFLARQGVNLNATPITELIAQLNEYEQNQVTAIAQDMGMDTQDLTRQISQNATEQAKTGTSESGSAAQIATGSLNSFQTVSQVKKALADIAQAPDVTIGAVVKEKAENEAVTITDFAQLGSSLKRKYEQAGQLYQAVGTAERKDLGDSVKKALAASTEDILSAIGMENTQANRDAVRILGVNSMEITKDSVNQIKGLYSELNHLINNMQPKTVLNMIRNNINPMTEDIHEVNEYLTKENKSITEAQKAEKYSRFLFKLERTGGISEEERTQFIGVYKMVNLFTKDAGAAIGALVKQNAEITMENLCTAYNSRNAVGMDQVLDDQTGMSEVEGTVNYYNNIFEATGDSITPSSLKKVNDNQAIGERSVENFCEAVDDAYDSKEEESYYEEYLNQIKSATDADQSLERELTRNDQPVTVNQIQAMEQIMSEGFFEGFMDQEKADHYIDSISSREALEKCYDEDKDISDQQLSEVLNSTDNQNFKDIETMRLQNQAIGLVKNLSLRHDYNIPFATEEGIGTIHLTLKQEEAENGRVSIHLTDEKLGEIALEAKISDDQAEITVLQGVTNESEDNQQETLSDRLAVMQDVLKDTYNLKEVNVSTVQQQKPERTTYEESAERIPTDRLYAMAKTMVVTLINKNI